MSSFPPSGPTRRRASQCGMPRQSPLRCAARVGLKDRRLELEAAQITAFRLSGSGRPRHLGAAGLPFLQSGPAPLSAGRVATGRIGWGMLSKTAKPVREGRRKIVIVAYERAKLLDVCGALQAFSDARQEDGHAAYQAVVVSEAGGLVATDTGLMLQTARLDETALRSVDTLLVVGFDPTMPPVTTASLRARLANYLDWPRRLGSICTARSSLPNSVFWTVLRQRRTGSFATGLSRSTRR